MKLLEPRPPSINVNQKEFPLPTTSITEVGINFYSDAGGVGGKGKKGPQPPAKPLLPQPVCGPVSFSFSFSFPSFSSFSSFGCRESNGTEWTTKGSGMDWDWFLLAGSTSNSSTRTRAFRNQCQPSPSQSKVRTKKYEYFMRALAGNDRGVPLAAGVT